VKYFDSFKLFDFGRIYDVAQMKGLLPTEKFKLTGAIVPEFQKKNLQTETFYEAKAVVEDLLSSAGINGSQVKPLGGELNKWVHPGMAAGFYRGKQLLAEIYKLHPAIAEANGIRNNVYLFQIHINEIEKSERKFKYNPIVKFPGVPFDITVVADEKKLAGDIQLVIKKAAKKSLRELSIFSVYQSEDMAAGTKSVSFRMTFGADTHTLKPDEVESLQTSVIQALDKAGYPLK
jgi:phenylalanyl-tRNA synthetase beta chain